MDSDSRAIPTVFYAEVLDGYVFSDGSLRQEFNLNFTDLPCVSSLRAIPRGA